jgi:hypothetical protein
MAGPAPPVPDGQAALVWNLDLLNEVLSRPAAQVLKSIPSGARRQVATCLTDLIRHIVLHPLDVGAYVRLFLFPRAVLRCMPAADLMRLRRKRRWYAQKVFTLRCLTAWLAGGEQRDGLVQAVLSLPTSWPRGTDLAERNLKRCERIAREDGQFRKAIKALAAQGLAMPGVETMQALRDLHPVGPPVETRSTFADGFEVDIDLVREALQSFPKGSSSGRSGMAVTHLMECCAAQSSTPAFLEQLTALVNLFLTGRALPAFASFMASANLVPLLKKDGRSVRPIAVGEVLRRLISKCCLKRVSGAAAAYLCPMQLGVRVRNGAEAILHAFNRFIRDPVRCDGDSVLALIDFSNAFNSVDRNSMLNAVLSRFPGMFGWVQYCYGVGARLYAGCETIEAFAGCQQGDPLGPLLFALVLQPLLLRLRDEFGLTVGAYLDDLTVAGPSHRVSDAVRWLRVEGPRHGLHISPSKTVVWSPSGHDLTGNGLFDDLTHSTEDGVELLGGAVSTSATFCAAVIAKRVDKCIATMHRMLELNDPQLCLLLLRSCEGMPKLVYSWRTLPPEYLQEAATRFEAELVEALRWIVAGDGPHFGPFQRRLATLPVSMGGLGIAMPSDLLHFCYCASALSSFDLQQEILGLPHPPSEQDLPGSWSARLDTVATLVAGPEAPALRREVLSYAFPTAAPSNNTAVPPKNIQLFMARVYFEAQRVKLTDHPYFTSKDEATKRRFKAILDSTCHVGTSAWLFALPNGGLGQRMTPLAFQAAVSLRLLMPQFAPGSRCCQRSCEATMDVYGYHALVIC